MIDRFAIGQRWLNSSQPELGLGLVTGTETSRVTIYFPACQETRIYAVGSAPLRRVKFAPGDTIGTQSGESLVVEEVVERDGLLLYTAQGQKFYETSLADTLVIDRPELRLLAQEIDSSALFRLRRSVLLQRFRARTRPVAGLCGARITLFPHQLYIAREVAGRQAPRVLLADEVGLGKTIEAGLILHQMLVNGRAGRVLILVPEPLVLQWFVEMLRRFQLSFAIFDEERALSIEAEDPSANPFLENQLILAATGWLTGDSRRTTQTVEAGWDLLVVDEAHHLEWSAEVPSPAYSAVEALAKVSEGILLLTATPEQLGREGHFARLRLLDPDRYDCLERFQTETAHFEEISLLAGKIREGKAADPEVRETLARLLVLESVPESEGDLLPLLLDAHGPGRVIFRNRRESLSGFPSRQVHLKPLPSEPDSKILHISQLLQELPLAKFLLICRTPESVRQIEAALRHEINVDVALFHEELTLVQRDRNAAWFAEEDGGARLLLCSEIGSEGRNFQFAHHLILFDLPPNPGLLEQRIGRLDRIGQTSTIHLHVLFREGTMEEFWARWYHEALDAFSHTLHGSETIHTHFSAVILLLQDDDWESAWPSLKRRAISFRKKLLATLANGRDHLLELSSFHPEEGQALAAAIREIDEDQDLEQLMLLLWDHFGVTVEDLGRRHYLLKAGPEFAAPSYPSLPATGLAVTFDRATALAREDLTFLTWDHPLVASSLDTFLASKAGQAGFLEIESPEEEALLLDLTFVLETMAPAKLHPDRFLPPFPIRVIVDHLSQDRTVDFPPGSLRQAREGDPAWLRQHAPALKELLNNLLKRGRRYAQQSAKAAKAQALAAMERSLQFEWDRLLRLRSLGHPVRDSEITLTRSAKESLARFIQDSRLRLDSIRLIRSGGNRPAPKGTQR